jgi:hypothetical protein
MVVVMTVVLVREITDLLWEYGDVRKTVGNNYIVLQSIVRNVVRNLNINNDNFNLESFMDNFDVHELDLQSQDTFVDSLTELLVRFKVGGDVDVMMDGAPGMIENRLREIIDYLRHNPNDVEAMDYAKLMVSQLSEFDGALAMKYSRELDTMTLTNTKPVVFKQRKPSKLRKVLVGLVMIGVGLISIPLFVVYTVMSAMRWWL